MATSPTEGLRAAVPASEARDGGGTRLRSAPGPMAGATTGPMTGPTTGPALASFEDVYRHEYHSVVALAYALTGRGAVAEELAQDAFLAAHRNWAKIGAYSSPGAFVRRVVANMSLSTRRRWAAEARALARVAARSPRWEPPAAEHDAEFWRYVRALPAHQAQALALRYLEDRSDADIAEILGCSEPTVRAHLHHGRVALAARLLATTTKEGER